MKPFAILLALLALTLCTPPAQAATFVVSQGNVNQAIDAINRANQTPEHDTIRLAAGDYYLTRVNNNTDGPNGLPSITSPITIYSHGARIGRTNGGEPDFFRIFHVAPSGNLTLNDLIIEGGAINDDGEMKGAGILSKGFLNLSRTVVRDNGMRSYPGGGGIVNTGTLVMTQSTIQGNAEGDGCRGGVLNQNGTVSIVRSTIEGNFAYDNSNGGGLCNEGGSLGLIESSVRDNFTAGTGGGLCNEGGSLGLIESSVRDNFTAGTGGGIFNDNGFMHIEGSTISGNTINDSFSGGGIRNTGELMVSNSTISRNRSFFAGGGGIANGGTLRLRNVTVTENQSFTDAPEDAIEGGGISNSRGTVSIEQSIIAGNTVGSSPTLIPSDCAGPITSQGFNLVGRGTGCPRSGSGDQAVSPDRVFTTVLGPLQDNGGETQTHEPLPGSPATDAVPDAGCLFSRDQRGEPRPESFASRCDIGAVEVAKPSCEALFGDAPGFTLCDETTDTCSFNARTDGGTCDQICRSLGSRCVGAIDNEENSCREIVGSNDTCQTQRITEICICEH